MVKIKTNKFILRPIKLEDSKEYYECFNDFIARKMFITYPKSIEDAIRKVKIKLNDLRTKKGETFAIEINNKFIGFVEIHDLNKKHFKHRATIGYCIHKDYRGEGIVSKAVKIVSNYAFKKYKLKRLEGMCRDFNKASARVLEKCGFKLEGILRKNKFVNGRYLNDMLWAKVK
jgi:ribosomal-protein-alanine N-acetyltransferase